MLICSHSIVPNQVSDLTESGATTTSVTATWTKPAGVVDSYLVSCSAGTTADYTEPENNDGSTHTATCSGLPTAGDNYTITVTSQSVDKSGTPASVQVTACKDMQSCLLSLRCYMNRIIQFRTNYYEANAFSYSYI